MSDTDAQRRDMLAADNAVLRQEAAELRSVVAELIEATEIDPRDLPHHEEIVVSARERARKALGRKPT